MYWYLRRTFSQRQDQNLRKRKRERGKNVRICSPLSCFKTKNTKKKKRGALERYCCWSSQVPICVRAPCDPLPLTPDPCHSCAELQPTELSIICRCHGGVTEPHTWQVVTSNKPHLPVSHRGRSKIDTVAFLILLLLRSLNTKMWSGLQRCGSSSDYQRHCKQTFA